MNCPKCNKAMRIIDHDTYIWSHTVTIYITHKCNQCGKLYTSQIVTDREGEKIIDENV